MSISIRFRSTKQRARPALRTGASSCKKCSVTCHMASSMWPNLTKADDIEKCHIFFWMTCFSACRGGPFLTPHVTSLQYIDT